MRIALLPFFLLIAQPAATLAQGLGCTGTSGGHLGREAICAGVSARLGSTGQPLQLEVLRDEPKALSARLTWPGQRGPRVDVTSAERPLDARAIRRLADGLLRSTDLP